MCDEHLSRRLHGQRALECAYRIDLLVEDAEVVEVKSVARLDAVHELLSYLELSKKTVGLLRFL